MSDRFFYIRLEHPLQATVFGNTVQFSGWCIFSADTASRFLDSSLKLVIQEKVTHFHLLDSNTQSSGLVVELRAGASAQGFEVLEFNLTDAGEKYHDVERGIESPWFKFSGTIRLGNCCNKTFELSVSSEIEGLVAHSNAATVSLSDSTERIFGGPSVAMPERLYDTQLLLPFWSFSRFDTELSMVSKCESPKDIRTPVSMVSAGEKSVDLGKEYPEEIHAEKGRCFSYFHFNPETCNDISIHTQVSDSESSLSIFHGNTHVHPCEEYFFIETVNLTSSDVKIRGIVLSPSLEVRRLVFATSRSRFNSDEKWYLADLGVEVIWSEEADDVYAFGGISSTRLNRFEFILPFSHVPKFPGVIDLCCEVGSEIKRFEGVALREILTPALSEYYKEEHKCSFSKQLVRDVVALTPPSVVSSENSLDFALNNQVTFISHNGNVTEGAPRVLLELAREVKNDFKLSKLLSLSGDVPAEEWEGSVTINQAYVRGISVEEYQRAQLRIKEEIMGSSLVIANSLDSFIAVDTAWRLNIPVIWILHESVDPVSQYQELDPWIRLRYLKALEKASIVVFVSEATESLYEGFVSKSTVIRNGLDLTGFSNALNAATSFRERLGISSDAIVCLSVGTTTERKGQDVSIREFDLLRRNFPDRDMHFVIVGAREIPYLDTLKDLIKNYSLESCVHLIAETPEVHQYYSDANYFILSSRQESSPLVVLEAFAAKLPVISTDVFGLPELVKNNETGLIFDPNVSGDLAETLGRLMQSPDLFDRVTRTAYDHLEKNLDVRRTIEAYRALALEMKINCTT